MTKSEWVVRSTPFPNILIDEMMPKLRDTEWRLLVCITRASLGWVDKVTGQRQRTALLSGYQLRRQTGRESEAISRAIDNLVRAKIIAVSDQFGNELGSTNMRRRARQKLKYGLHRSILIRLLL